MPVVREWKYKGYRCYVYKAETPSMEHHNGYVVLPPEHQDHGKDYDDIDVRVHGGLTYAENGDHVATHDYPGKQESCTIGFDCAHLYDATHPDGSFCGVPQDDEYPNHYWTEEEVAAEVEQLVDQLDTHPLIRRVKNIWNESLFWRMVRNIINTNE
jgi:hypothetical protein